MKSKTSLQRLNLVTEMFVGSFHRFVARVCGSNFFFVEILRELSVLFFALRKIADVIYQGFSVEDLSTSATEIFTYLS